MKEFQLSKIISIGVISIFFSMCVPPEENGVSEDAAYDAYLDSLRDVRCPRLMSSAAEYYKNRDWASTIRVYRELVDLGCDRDDPVEVYQYYAIAYEYLGQFDSSEFVLVKGLQLLPNNVELLKRLSYAYSIQNKSDLQITTLNRLSELIPENIQVKMDLAELYGKQELYDDQIDILEGILKIDPANEKAQSDIAIVYELTGKDPLDVYRERFRTNSDNVSFGTDLADRLLLNDEPQEAVEILKKVLKMDNSSKLAYRKLGQAYYAADELDDASNAYEELFKLNPRDIQVALKICDINTAGQNYAKALRWADKVISMDKMNGDSYGRKGNVYYKSFQDCRTPAISLDDRVVASLAFNNFNKAEELNSQSYKSSRTWLLENEVLFTRAQWFMLDDDIKNQGYVIPRGECYSWIQEKLQKNPKW
ncbi:MAG: tetratricopeptide repeat protein [Fidelibacterota bacterium]